MATPQCPNPQVPNYIFTDKVGSGTYATVYKAYRKIGSRDVVAVKCVRKASLNNVSKENLLTEIELLKTLKHDHIVQLKDFTWDENYIYLIMEYCSGGDLSSFLRSRRTLPEYIVRRFLQQLASALHYMRSKHVSHMDLKPSNILLSCTDNPQLKIGDFGFAHYLIGETDALFLRGSLLYMAPEIIILRQYNEKADLWSIGVILYECLFSRAPFASKTMKELENKIKDSSPIEIPCGVNISDICRNLLHRLLQREPDLRMNYDEFLTHSFLDFEHRPCSESLNKATELVSTAVSKDSLGQYQEAVSLYCQALEYFIPAIHYEKDNNKKNQLRQKVSQYIKRAEELKELMKPKPSTSKFHQQQQQQHHHQQQQPVTESNGSTESSLDELIRLSNENTQLLSALNVAYSAEQKEANEDYLSASEKYEASLEILLRLLAEESKGRRRDLLHSEISRWMSRAEIVKKYLRVKDIDMKEISKKEEEDSSSFLSACSIQ